MNARHIRRFLGVILLLGLAMLPTLTVSAASEGLPTPDGGIVLVGEPWILPSGETYTGDVVIISANATVAKNAVLKGDLAVIRGDASVAGTIQGDLVVINGNVLLKPNSVIEGNVSFVGGKLTRLPGAVIKGDIVRTNVTIPADVSGVIKNLPPTLVPLALNAMQFAPPEPGSPQWIIARLFDLITGVLGAFFTAIILAAIAAFFVIVWPAPTHRVAETIQQVPIPAFLVGVVVALTAFVMGILLIITICLSPFGLLLFLGLLAAWLMGWSAMGGIVGKWLWEALNLSPTSDTLPTAVGTFLISLIAAVPCIGTLFGLVIGSVGIGAVVLSYFGTRVPETI